jgi:hypothetical protein
MVLSLVLKLLPFLAVDFRSPDEVLDLRAIKAHEPPNPNRLKLSLTNKGSNCPGADR